MPMSDETIKGGIRYVELICDLAETAARTKYQLPGWNAEEVRISLTEPVIEVRGQGYSIYIDARTMTASW